MAPHAAQTIVRARTSASPIDKIGGLRCVLRHLLAGMLCLFAVSGAQATVTVVPLSEQVLSTGPDASDAALSPLLEVKLIPENEWKRYCNRPHAFDLAANTVQNQPNGAVGYVRDPAYLPIMLMTEPKASRSKSRNTATTAAPSVPVVKSPYVPSPQVASPTAPTVGSPSAPTVANPYSATAAPTGPVSSPGVSGVASSNTPLAPTTPTSPTAPGVASPSLAAQPSAEDGIMTSGRGIMADMAGRNAATGSANAASDSSSTSGGSASQNSRDVLRGPASTLVVPPAGISLTPNNGSGALTAPVNPQ